MRMKVDESSVNPDTSLEVYKVVLKSQSLHEPKLLIF